MNSKYYEKSAGSYDKKWKSYSQNTLDRLIKLFTPIDISESEAAQSEVLMLEEPYSRQLPAYFSLDVRLSHTRQKSGYTRIWSLDILNVTGRENLGWYYYDSFSEEVKAQYQLKLIPVIAYRIQF